MNVRVIVDKWGRHSKGDIVKDMPLSTANACIAKGVVEDENSQEKVKPSKKEKQKDEA